MELFRFTIGTWLDGTTKMYSDGAVLGRYKVNMRTVIAQTIRLTCTNPPCEGGI